VTGRRALAAGLASILLLASCTGDRSSPDRPKPASASVTSVSSGQTRVRVQIVDTSCPDDVAGAIIGRTTCGYLDVPERRDGATQQIKVFVTRFGPPGGSRREPVLVVGTDLGMLPNYGGIAPIAQRVGRDVIIVDVRGTGHSEPALDCPEVDARAFPSLAVPTDNAGASAGFVQAVGACFRRLTGEGIDVSAYNLSEMAADLEDLRMALGIDQWDVITYGTASRIALQLVRDAPEHVRALILDSPELPGMDPWGIAATRTTDAISSILATCASDSRCHHRFPDAQASLNRALHALVRHPLTLRLVNPADGSPVRVLLDAGMLLRLLRQTISDGGSSGQAMTAGAVPTVLESVLAARTTKLANDWSPALLWPQTYCVGYQPHCLPLHQVSVGAEYSVLCHDVEPFTSPALLSSTHRQLPGVREAYLHNPYRDICQSWPVGQAAANVGEPVESDTPTLVTVGSFDPYLPVGRIKAAMVSMRNALIVRDPAGAHNVIGRTECLLAFRAAWLQSPSGTLSAPACMRSARVEWDLH
jgi:pimeloyl-ACP methyl ester carboxylesterase